MFSERELNSIDTVPCTIEPIDCTALLKLDCVECSTPVSVIVFPAKLIE